MDGELEEHPVDNSEPVLRPTGGGHTASRLPRNHKGFFGCTCVRVGVVRAVEEPPVTPL